MSLIFQHNLPPASYNFPNVTDVCIFGVVVCACGGFKRNSKFPPFLNGYNTQLQRHLGMTTIMHVCKFKGKLETIYIRYDRRYPSSSLYMHEYTCRFSTHSLTGPNNYHFEMLVYGLVIIRITKVKIWIIVPVPCSIFYVMSAILCKILTILRSQDKPTATTL